MEAKTSTDEETLDCKLLKSPSLLEFNFAKEENQDDDLKQTVENLSPRISALFDASERSIEHFLSGNSDVSADSLRMGSITENMDDGLASEWKRLPVLEPRLHEEIHMSVFGWQYHETDSPEDSNYGKSPLSLDLLTPLSKAIQTQFSSEDLGLPTISLLSMSEIQGYHNIPIFETHQNVDYTMYQRTQAAQSLLLFAREYILPLSDSDLIAIFVGTTITKPIIQHHLSKDILPISTNCIQKNDNGGLAFRTVTMRMRPDVLCGAVMDAIQASIQNLFHGEITKRQGGHLTALLPSLRCTGPMNNQHHQHLQPEVILPSISLDIQLVSKRSREFDRILLIRSYKGQETNISTSSSTDVYDLNLGDISVYWDTHEIRLIEAANSVKKLLFNTSHASYPTSVDMSNRNPRHSNSLQKYAKYIAQEFKRKSPLKKGHALPIISTDTEAELMRDISLDSLQISREDHSNKPRIHHVPILEQTGFPYFIVSKLFIMVCFNELESRGLSYSSLPFLPFGKFPAVSTICPHYCSQIRDTIRLSMLRGLLRSSKELDSYVSDEDSRTRLLSDLLTPRFDMYKIYLPPYPKLIPLENFPLDFQAPEVSSPPWGPLVSEAINRIPAFMSSYQETTDFDKARDAVLLISKAFQEQSDDEFTKRLSRKNLQVLDRLGRLKAYQRALVEYITDVYSLNTISAENADRFHRYANRIEATTSSYAVENRVPLFECNISMGVFTGLCLITAYEMLLITRLIPVVGEKKYELLKLSDIEVSVASVPGPNPWDPSSCLRHSASSISVSHKGDNPSSMFSFKPAIPPFRFKTLIDMLKELNSVKNRDIQLSSSSGFLSLLHEHNSFIKAALGDGA